MFTHSHWMNRNKSLTKVKITEQEQLLQEQPPSGNNVLLNITVFIKGIGVNK